MRHNRLLAWFHSLAQRIDRRLGEPVTRKPSPPQRAVVVIEAMADPFRCTGCRFWSASGWLLDGEPYCNLCARPHVRARYSKERSETPTLTGDPG